MFTFDEKLLYHRPSDHPCKDEPCKDPTGHFPPEKPPFTPDEQLAVALKEIKDTITTIMKFKGAIEADYEKMMGILTSDNVLFKQTFSENYNEFLETVRTEINSFEDNVDSSLAFYKESITAEYHTLFDNLNNKVEEYKASLNQTYDTFRDAIESRIEQYNSTYLQTVNDLHTSLNLKITELENDLNASYATFTTGINSSIRAFQLEWTELINARLDGQDAMINDTVVYIRANIASAIENIITEMENNGEVNDIVNNIITSNLSRRMEITNDSTATKGILELANFAGQGTSDDIYGVIVHHYTDSPAMRIDNVGEGSILQLVNARNPVRRPDKSENYHGTGSPIYYIVQNDIDGDGNTNNTPLFYMTEDGDLYWTGWNADNAGGATKDHPVKFVTNKHDAGTWGFVLECANAVGHVLNVKSGGQSIMEVLKADENGNTQLVFPQGGVARADEYLNLIAGTNMVIQVGNSDQNAIRFRIGGTYYYPQMTNKFCTSTTRPTSNVCVGEIYMETDTNRTIRRNSTNTGWVDMNGSPV